MLKIDTRVASKYPSIYIYISDEYITLLYKKYLHNATYYTLSVSKLKRHLILETCTKE